MKKLLLHLSLTTLPLVAFTAILLALVYLNPFQGSTTSGDLTLDTSFTSDILYVNYSATRLILVASWSSSMALPIIGSLLTFASYTVAADMISSSHHGHHVLLPTPAQLAMLTDLLDAKHMAILTWLSSFWRKDERKVPSRWIIEFPAIVQLAALSLRCAKSCYLDVLSLTMFQRCHHRRRHLAPRCHQVSHEVLSIFILRPKFIGHGLLLLPRLEHRVHRYNRYMYGPSGNLYRSSLRCFSVRHFEPCYRQLKLPYTY